MHIDLLTQLPQVSIIPSSYTTTNFKLLYKQHTFGSYHRLGFLGTRDPGNFHCFDCLRLSDELLFRKVTNCLRNFSRFH